MLLRFFQITLNVVKLLRHFLMQGDELLLLLIPTGELFLYAGDLGVGKQARFMYLTIRFESIRIARERRGTVAHLLPTLVYFTSLGCCCC